MLLEAYDRPPRTQAEVAAAWLGPERATESCPIEISQVSVMLTQLGLAPHAVRQGREQEVTPWLEEEGASGRPVLVTRLVPEGYFGHLAIVDGVVREGPRPTFRFADPDPRVPSERTLYAWGGSEPNARYQVWTFRP